MTCIPLRRRGMALRQVTFRRAAIAGPLAVSLILVSGSAHAATTFTSEASFLSAAGPLSFESFEDLAPTNTVGTVEALTLAGFTLSHSGPTTQAFDTLTGFNFATEGQFATHGSKWVYARSHNGGGSTGNTETIVFSFNHLVSSFGFTITDALDTATGPNQLSLTTNGGDAAMVLTGMRSNGNQAFFGIISGTPFTQVQLHNQKSQDGYGLDRIHFTAVPEPGGWALIAGAMGFLARRPARFGSRRSQVQ